MIHNVEEKTFDFKGMHLTDQYETSVVMNIEI